MTDAATAASRIGHARPLALGYIRVWAGDQVENGASLDAQHAALVAKAQMNGWDLEVVREEGRSAKNITGRPLLVDALARLDRSDADVLLVFRLDRVSRSTIDFLSLDGRARRNGWAITLADASGIDTSHPNGRMVLTMLAAVAQNEREMISLRTREGMAKRKAEGVKFGRPRALPDDVRQRIARDRANGMTLTAIADALNEEGVPTAHGGRKGVPGDYHQGDRLTRPKMRLWAATSVSSAHDRRARTLRTTSR